jgi:outer membrane protein
MISRYGEKDERTLKSKEKYNRVYSQLVTANEGQVEKYNEGIWKQINVYLKEYGTEHGYSFIYGANGNGSIMFADSTLEISKDVIPYLNKRYSGE